MVTPAYFLLFFSKPLGILDTEGKKNNRIYTAPYGRNFGGTGGRSDQCSVKAWANKKVLNLDLKTDRESLLRTDFGSEF